MRSKWTPEKLRLLGQYVNDQGLDFKAAGKKLGFSASACSRKYDRTDWEDFESNLFPPRPWTAVDMEQLRYMKEESGLPYKAIAKKLKRSVSQVESKFQHTDWEDHFRKNEEERKAKESGVNTQTNDEEFSKEDEGELESETARVIEEASAFYDREVARYQD